MNITEFMSFDLEWFTTPEGLLITGGVIVLLIALIIFIISNKKTEKKTVEEVQDNNVNAMPEVAPTNEVIVPSMDTQVIPETNVATMDFANPAVQNGYVAVPVNEVNVAPVVENPVPVNDNVFRATSFNNMVAPVEESVAPVAEVNNVTPNNVIDFTQLSSVPNSEPVMPVAPAQEIVTPVATVEPVANVTSEQMATPAPVVSEPQPYVAPVVEEKPVIYGGVSPVNTFTSNEPVAKPVIYGGADPLENTTTLPRMSNHEAYSATPTVAPVVEAPVVSPAPVASEVQSYVAPTAPVGEQTPVATPTQPVMPMTGAEMFATTDINENNGSSSSSSDIETLEF